MGWSPFRKTGLTHHTPAQTVKGYTLVTPANGDSTYLIDMAGRIAQRWHFSGLRVFYGRLLPTGKPLLRKSPLRRSLSLPLDGSEARFFSLRTSTPSRNFAPRITVEANGTLCTIAQRSEVEFLYGICCCVLLQVINEPVCEAG